jgi:hypothetical protein
LILDYVILGKRETFFSSISNVSVGITKLQRFFLINQFFHGVFKLLNTTKWWSDDKKLVTNPRISTGTVIISLLSIIILSDT